MTHTVFQVKFDISNSRNVLDAELKTFIKARLVDAFHDRNNWRADLAAKLSELLEKHQGSGRNAKSVLELLNANLISNSFDSMLNVAREHAARELEGCANAKRHLNELDRHFGRLRKSQKSGTLEDLPKLLWRADLFAHSCELKLPLFLKSNKLIGDVERAQVVSVGTSTGTG